MPDLPLLNGIDDGFMGVNSRLDPGRVPEGYVCEAINRIFENQIIKNRWGVVQPKWGGLWTYETRTGSVTTGSSSVTNVSGPIPLNTIVACDTSANNELVFKAGTRITYQSVDNTNCTMSTAAYSFTGSNPKTFKYYASTSGITSIVGMLTYRDEVTGKQGLLVASNVARTSDGGQGKVYLLRPNQSHLEVSLHGHDFYDDIKFVQCGNGVVLMRPGPARYYFKGSSANSTTNKFTLNVTPDLQTGDRVIINTIGNSQPLWQKSTSVPSGQGYGLFVNVVGAAVSLHLTYGDAIVGANKLSLNASLTSSDRFYLELQNTITGNDITQGLESFQNDGLPLIMQSSYDTVTSKQVTALDNGFNRIPSVSSIISASADNDTLTVPNHNFVAGDQVTISNAIGITGVSSGNYYVYPVDNNTIKLFTGDTADTDSLNDATIATGTVIKSGTTIGSITINNQGAGYLAAPTVAIIDGGGSGATASATITDGKVTAVTVTPGSGYSGTPTCTFSAPSTLVNITNVSSPSGTIKKYGASGANVPAGRTGLYFQNRLLMVYGNDYLAVSDVLDPLHYQALSNEFKLNTGTNDRVVAIYPFNATTLVVFKERSVLAIENLYGDLSSTRLMEVTREFGCVAPNSIVGTGSDIIFLSQRGVVSMKQTDYGTTQSVVVPMSDDVQDLISQIDQGYWNGACAAYFDNRYILSVPIEGQGSNNTKTLVFNFLNKAWEGYWEGSLLIPKYYERLVIANNEYLVFSDASNYINYFYKESLCDRSIAGVEHPIETKVTFRGYQGGSTEHKQWTDLKFEFNTWNPEYSISTIFEGVSEEFIYVTNATKDRTKYYTYGVSDYVTTNSNDNFLARYRQDYSTKPVLQCGSNGFKSGLHQGFMHKVRLKGHCATLQPVLETSQGSVIVISCMVSGLPYRLYGKNDS